jgi:hypothetical protein
MGLPRLGAARRRGVLNGLARQRRFGAASDGQPVHLPQPAIDVHLRIVQRGLHARGVDGGVGFRIGQRDQLARAEAPDHVLEGGVLHFWR